ncbi:MAG TPA: hypothetical protein VMT89_07035, partial [Candidatus Acidoferrales bacterium]|nr:hypothetical protein [Candidatus Acidoferrales bacterium]
MRTGLLLATIVAAAGLASCGGGHSDPFAKCGNGHIDAGEQCDDGNLLDNDDCSSTCVPAVCGDGFIDKVGVNHEDCEGTILDNASCNTLGFVTGTLTCNSSCRFDTSQCGPKFTPTPIVVATPTATATATPSTVCGNGLLETGETCDSCPGDCSVKSCTAAGTMTTLAVIFASPSRPASGVTVQVGYRSDLVSLPGTGAASSVSSRVKNRPQNSIFAVNDLDYALRVVASRAGSFADGRLFTVAFDDCFGGAAPQLDDFSCT